MNNPGYDPEERLIHFLQGRVAQQRGQATEARRHYEDVIAATGAVGGNRYDILASAARQSLGQGGAVTIPVDLTQSGDLDAVLLVRALSLPVR